jgi:predicted permease
MIQRIRNLRRRDRVDADIDAELQSHIELAIEEAIHAGHNPADARREAMLRFGNPVVIRERALAADAALAIDGIARDLRFALRQLRRSPGFATTAIITLALGIGANVVVFGVLNAVLLSPLPVRDPSSLYQLRHQQWASFRLLTHSYRAFQDLQRRNTTFTGMAAINAYSNGQLRWGNAVTAVHGDEVSGNYFDLLGVAPQRGQFFHAGEEHGPNSAPYLVLSDALWHSAFHGDPAVIGTTVELDKHPFTVLGVASPQFQGTERFVWPDYWMPMLNQQQTSGADYLDTRASVAVTVIGRLKPGVSPRQAEQNLSAISAELNKEYPQTDDGQPLRLVHLGLYGDDGEVIRAFLWGVTALALLVLAAACANLGSLFAARAADRSRELALRVALGASRRRLVRQLLTEATLLALLGGAAGLAAAALLLVALDRWHSEYGHMAVSIDARVYLAALVFTLASALLFGLVPARQAWRSHPLQSLKGSLPDSLHLRRFAPRDLLLGAQIAICTLLVTASLVAVRGMERLLHAPLGFQPQGAMLANIDLSQDANLQSGGDANSFGDPAVSKVKSILDAARAIPGVTAVGTVSRTPMTGGMRGVPIFSPGTVDFTLRNAVLAPYVFTMSPGYLRAAGTRLLTGRDVAWTDTPQTPWVAVVNATCARKMWGVTPAIGQRIILSGHLTEVVGVAEDGKYHDLQESPQPVVYLPLSQSDPSEIVFVVRSWRLPHEMAAALEHALSAVEPNIPVTVESWSDSFAGQLFPARTATVALGIMGLLAAMLAVTSIFGAAAYSVSKRMKELGIRVALGARRSQVLSAAVGRPVVLLAAGSLLGLLAGILASRLLAHIVYQANAQDPVVMAGAMATMALLGAAATLIPARRALRVDPARLMRED